MALRAADGDLERRLVGTPLGRISYLAAGGGGPPGGRTILLIHGSGVSARSWAGQLRGLGGAARVLAVDLPGHGESDAIPQVTVETYAEAARGLLDSLGTGPVFVAGHSLGGGVALALAARHPEAVQGLVLLSACARLPEARGSLWGFLYWSLPGPLRKLLFFWTAKKVLFAPGASWRAIQLGMEEIRTCRPDILLEDVAAARAMDLEAMARTLRVPTLILCGRRDKVTPPAYSRRLHDLIAGSRLDLLEGAGHMLPLEAPGRVNQAILEFMTSVAPGGGDLPGSWRVGAEAARSAPRPLAEAVKGFWARLRAALRPRGDRRAPPGGAG